MVRYTFYQPADFCSAEQDIDYLFSWREGDAG